MVLLFMQVKSAYIQGYGSSTSIPTVAEFFPQIQSDLSRVKWGHGINSKIHLSRSLQGIKVCQYKFPNCFLIANKLCLWNK